MTQILRELSAVNASRQNAVNFTMLLLIILMAMYFGLTGLEHSEALRAV